MSQSVSHSDSDGKPRRMTEFLGRVLDSTKRHVQFRRIREEPRSLADMMNNSKLDGKPAESMFLCRLPVEVRLLICDYVFADQKTFLFVHGACTSLRNAVPPGSDINFDSLQWTSYPFAKGLLRTCRQIYAEGLTTAVNSSVFYLRGPVAFSHLDNRALRTVRPERLSLINHLDLQWDFRVKGYEAKQHGCPETDFATWQRIWDVVAVNMRLKSLELRLAFTGPKDQMSVDAPWLMPLRQVRSIKSLKVDIRDSKEPRLMLYTLNSELWDVMMAKKQPIPIQTRMLTHHLRIDASFAIPMSISAPSDFGMGGYFLLNRESDRPYPSRLRALKNEWSRYEIEKQRKKGKKLYFGVMGGHTSVAEPEAGFIKCLRKGRESPFCKVMVGMVCTGGQGLPI